MRRRDLHSTIFSLILLGFCWLCPATLMAQAETDADTEPMVQANETTPPAAAPALTSPFAGAGEDESRPLNITLDSMDIYIVLDHLLGQILQLNYVVDPAIKGTISLHIQGTYSRRELLDVLNSVLQMHGLAITRGAQDLYKVVRKADSGKSGSEIVMPGEARPHPGDVIQVFQLRYLAAAPVIANIRNFVSPGAVLVAEPSVNAVLLADTVENVDKVARLLALLDVDVFKDIHWRLFALEQTDVADLAQDLDQIFKNQGLYARQGIDPGGLQLMPLKTINALLVVTRWEDLLDVVAKWVTELDQGQTEKGSRVYVYFVQNGNSKDIADLLNQLYGGKAAKKDTGKKTVIVERKKEVEKPPVEVPSGELTGEVDIIADEVNNAILMRATPRDYAIISEVLEKIDVMPRQVLIDVLIFDVDLTDDLEYGVEWFLDSKVNIGSEDFGALTILSNPGVTPEIKSTVFTSAPNGFSFVLFDKNQLRALFHLLASKTNVHIVASPNILALDNQESTIESGQEVPVKTGETSTSLAGAGTVSTFQYRNAGTILKVKPSVNDRGLVRMEVTQESSNVIDPPAGVEGVAFKTRKATTNLVAEDGQTVIIGGLIETQREQNHVGIPLLKDLPILGYLFGSHGYKTMKRELLIAITPHVVTNRAEADALTREFSEKVEGLKEALSGRALPGEDVSPEAAPIDPKMTEEPEP